MHSYRRLWGVILLGATACLGRAEEPIAPDDEVIRPFNGRDLSGLYTWLKETGRAGFQGTARHAGRRRRGQPLGSVDPGRVYL